MVRLSVADLPWGLGLLFTKPGVDPRPHASRPQIGSPATPGSHPAAPPPQDPEVSDEELIAAHVRGDASAFGQLYGRYVKPLLRLMVRAPRSSEEARDLVQQTFLQLHRARADYDASRRFRPWFGNPRALTPGRWVTVAFGVLLVVATAALLAPLSRAWRDARQIVFAALALATPVARFLLVGRTDAAATNSAWACFAIGVLCSAPAFVLLHVMARRPRLSVPELALLGATAGLGANMALQLHCIDKRLDHLLAGHAVIGVVWIACSWLVVRSVARRV